MDQVKRIIEAALFVGLDKVLILRQKEARLNEDPVYVKLPVETENAWKIRSVEVWYPPSKTAYFKVTHSEHAMDDVKRVIDSVGQTPGLSLGTTRTYSTFEGSWIVAMAALASALAQDASVSLAS